MNLTRSTLVATLLVMVTLLPVGAVSTSAASAIVVETTSGRVLYQNNAYQERLIASTTKLMTALVAVEQSADLTEVITVGAESCNIEGSSIYLRIAEEITLEALIYGMLLHSGNDAAHAVAVHTAGSVEEFAVLMNEKSVELGMSNSHFMNPNGLDEEGHYASAYDMALLGRACLENEQVAKIMAEKSIALNGRVFQNHNKLLWQYEGCVGMKTGYTEKAGRTLVSAAQRDGMGLVIVTLGAPDDWRDHKSLFDHSFDGWTMHPLIISGDAVARIPTKNTLNSFVPVIAGESASYPLAEGEQVTQEIILDTEYISTNVSAGDGAGHIIFRLKGTEIAKIPLVYAHDVTVITAPEKGFFQRILGF